MLPASINFFGITDSRGGNNVRQNVTPDFWLTRRSLLARFDGVVALLDQLLHGRVHLLASKVVDSQPLHYGVRVVGLDLNWEAVDKALLDPVRSVRSHAHRYPLTLQHVTRLLALYSLYKMGPQN